MKHARTGLLAVLFVIVLAAIGCGGGGAGMGSTTSGGTTSGGTTSGGTGSEFAGSWSGTFDDQIPVNGSGTIALQVATTGHFTMTGHNDHLHTDLAGSGTIDAGGNLSGTVTNGSASGTLSGQLVLSGDTMTGSVIASNADGSDQLNVSLTR